jgi:tryptophan-rich sensory protein
MRTSTWRDDLDDPDDDDDYLDYNRPLAYERPELPASVVALLLFGGLGVGLGVLGASMMDLGFYERLAQPSWAPLPAVFAPAWITASTCAGLAAWLVWRSPINSDRAAALGWFAGMLVLAALWPAMFGAHQLGATLVALTITFASAFATVVAFGTASRIAAVLMVPYMGCAGFGAALLGALWWLN